MFSKMAWPNFFAQCPQGVPQERPPLVLLEVADVYLEQVAAERIKQAFQPYVVWGPDLPDAWAEQNLLSADLFRQERPFLVLAAGKVATGIKEFWQRKKFSHGHNEVIFLLGRGHTWPEAFKKMPDVLWVQVEGPRFWEAPALVKFLCQERHLHLAPAIEQYLGQSLPAQCREICAALDLLALQQAAQPDLTLEQVQALLHPAPESMFSLAALWGRQQQRLALQKILAVEDDAYWASCFSFLSGHLLKIADPSYWSLKKKKSSKYDQEIQQASKLWNEAKLRRDLRLLGRWEQQALEHDPLLPTELRLAQRNIFV